MPEKNDTSCWGIPTTLEDLKNFWELVPNGPRTVCLMVALAVYACDRNYTTANVVIFALITTAVVEVFKLLVKVFKELKSIFTTLGPVVVPALEVVTQIIPYFGPKSKVVVQRGDEAIAIEGIFPNNDSYADIINAANRKIEIPRSNFNLLSFFNLIKAESAANRIQDRD